MFRAFGKRSYSCRTQPHKGLCAKLHCHISTDLNFSGSMSQIQITCPGTWDFLCSLKTKHQISDWVALFRKMSKISLSKQSFHIKCSLKTKPVSIKREKLFSFVAGEGQGKWSPSSLEGVCLIWCCWDAMVTGTAENKPQAPGGLFLFSSPHFPVHFWDTNRRLKVEGSCVPASKRTRGQNLLIWARKPNLPSYIATFLGGDAVWAAVLVWFLTNRKWRIGEGSTLRGDFLTNW